MGSETPVRHHNTAPVARPHRSQDIPRGHRYQLKYAQRERNMQADYNTSCSAVTAYRSLNTSVALYSLFDWMMQPSTSGCDRVMNQWLRLQNVLKNVTRRRSHQPSVTEDLLTATTLPFSLLFFFPAF
jgi:hypothetical protein